MQEDRRQSMRTRALLGSLIHYPDNLRTVDVMTRNISDGGAQVEVDFTVQLPDAFAFVVRKGAPARKARLAWRRGNRAGLSFAA